MEVVKGMGSKWGCFAVMELGRSVVMTEGQQIEEQCPGGWALRFLSPTAACPQGAVRHSTAKARSRHGRLGWASEPHRRDFRAIFCNPVRRLSLER